MISTFTIRFRKFIWFLIFSFTLYCIPHIELLFPYKLHFHPSEAEAAETHQTTETQTTSPQGETLENPPEKEESP
jgi:hypothetical protein